MCRIHLSLNNNKVDALYPLLDYTLTLYRIVPVYLLQAYKHISRRSEYLVTGYRVTRPIELVFTHIMYMKIP